jgi:hypothetical protein
MGLIIEQLGKHRNNHIRLGSEDKNRQELEYREVD